MHCAVSATKSVSAFARIRKTMTEALTPGAGFVLTVCYILTVGLALGLFALALLLVRLLRRMPVMHGRHTS